MEARRWVKDEKGNHINADLVCDWHPNDSKSAKWWVRVEYARYLYETGRLDEWNVERPDLEPAFPQLGSVIEAHG